MDKTNCNHHQKYPWVIPRLTRMSVDETLGGIVLGYAESQEFHLTTGDTLTGVES